MLIDQLGLFGMEKILFPGGTARPGLAGGRWLLYAV